MRYRTRTLLGAVTLLVVAAGLLRWRYDARLAAYDKQRRAADRLEAAGASVLWSYVGPERLRAWKLLDGPLYRRPTHAYCDGVAEREFPAVALGLRELEIGTLVLLGRQVVPHARAAAAGRDDRVIDALRGHATLRRLVVDASIRGAPLEFDAPLYTRKDLQLLKEVLPKLQIDWSDVN